MKIKFRCLALLLVLCLFCVSVSAQAPERAPSETWPERAPENCDGCPDQSTEQKPVSPSNPAPTPQEPPAQKPSQPLTPPANGNKVDDIISHSEQDKQFITVTTKEGNYFYIIIDREKDGEPTVHFLNQVDARDLIDFVDQGPADCICQEKCKPGEANPNCPVCRFNIEKCAGKEPEPPVCICKERCQIGAANPDCPVCSQNLGDCAGVEVKEPECICKDRCQLGDVNTNCPVCSISIKKCEGAEAQEEVHDDDASHQKLSLVPVAVVLLILLGGGGLLIYREFIRPKKKAVNPDVDAYEEDDEEYPFQNEEETE